MTTLRSTLLFLLVLNLGLVNGQPRMLPASVFTFDDISQYKVAGSTRFLESFEVDVFTLKPGKKIRKVSTPGAEDLIIVKEGLLGINPKDKVNVIGPGSIAYIMPDETYTIRNEDSKNTVFYRLKFKPKNPLDMPRGLQAGGSFVVNWNDVKMKENEHGGRRDFFNRATAACENFEMHVSTLNEGLPSHPPHTHEPEEVILMIKGVATMSINNQNYVGSAGDLFFLPSGSLHGIRNTGKGECTYFAFQWK